ncbi:MAG: TetR/AcrR family transcriptional regulator [Actinomycetota bacterium]
MGALRANGSQTRPVGRVERRQQRTRIRLLEAGYGVMSEVGVDAATIVEITERADVGFGTFYNYFESKEALATDVLDCVIHNLGQRNDLVTAQLGETEPIRIVANSVRLIAREMIDEAVWAWWVAQPGLLVDRLREGHRAFAHRDFRDAMASGDLPVVADDFELAWGQLNWLLAGGVRDIIEGRHPQSAERQIVESILRLLGVDRTRATEAVARELPSYPDLPVDFSICQGFAETN